MEIKLNKPLEIGKGLILEGDILKLDDEYIRELIFKKTPVLMDIDNAEDRTNKRHSRGDNKKNRIEKNAPTTI